MARAPKVAGRTLLPLIAAAAAALWLAYALTSQDSVLGQGALHDALRIAAIVATALLSVAGLGSVVLSRALRGAEGEPTGFLRVIVYGVLTFAASFLTLRYFGFDVRAVLATSAIVTAAVGFAMQPTLGSMISGLALHMDRVIRVGDGVIHEGEWVEIVSLNWRTAIGRTTSGRTMIFPNARLSDSVLQVLPRDEPMEASFHFLATVDVRPEWITELVDELMVDLPLVEESLPILVAPVSYDPRQRALKYRVKYWIRRYASWDDVEAEAHRRLWYIFQRNGIAYPVQYEWPAEAGMNPPAVPTGYTAQEVEALVAKALAASAPHADHGAVAAALAARGELLMFAGDEYLVMPERTAGWTFLVLRGAAAASQALETLQEAQGAPGALVQQLGRTAAVKRIADDLAHHIGPYAEYAVNRAARTASDLNRLAMDVAQEIADPCARTAFLETVTLPTSAHVGPGAVLHAKRDAAGSLICGGGLRARDELAILAIPSL